ncbi:polysaccharide biosynthesis/export family protein [Verrucomicrobiota bacterium]
MFKKFTSSLLVVLCAVLVGCATAPQQAQVTTPNKNKVVVYRLKAMDPIVVQLKGLPAGADGMEDVVDEQGNITLPYIGQVAAAGRTTSELEKAIYKAYVDGEIYKSSISVTVTAQQKSFYVWGEVRSPGRYPLSSGTTLLQAVASTGGYSPYANQKKIQLSRGADTYFFNGRELERSPDKDPKIEADDVIRVWRSIL